MKIDNSIKICDTFINKETLITYMVVHVRHKTLAVYGKVLTIDRQGNRVEKSFNELEEEYV